MAFAEKVKELRLEKKLTQEKLADLVGVTKRTLINYEQGKCYPKQTVIVFDLAKVLGVSVGELMNDVDCYAQEAQEREGTEAAMEVQSFLSNARAMFAGGSLSDEDKDKVMRKLNEIYWDAKEQNRRK